MTFLDQLEIMPPKSAPKTCRITCRVCDKPATVKEDWPALLCKHCLDDLDATSAHVAECTQAVLRRMEANDEAWQKTVAESAAQAEWRRVCDAMVAVAEKRATKETFDRSWAKRKAEATPLAALLTEYEAFCFRLDQMGAELEKWHRATEELNAAYLNMELQP